MSLVLIVKSVGRTFLGVALIGGLVALGGKPVGAIGANVQATICGPDSRAVLTVHEPIGDSVVATPSVAISGTVEHATGIEIKVDDVYNSTVALTGASKHYSSSVTLQPGTHVITLQANDICLVRNAAATVVVTYQPAVQSGSGASVGTAAGGVAIGMGGGTAATSTSASPTNPINTAVRVLDLDTVAQDGPAKAFTRLALMMGGLATTTFAASIAGQVSLWTGRDHYHIHRRTLRMCGFIPMFLALMI